MKTSIYIAASTLLSMTVAAQSADQVIAEPPPVAVEVSQPSYYASFFGGGAFGGKYDVVWGPDYRENYDLDTGWLVGGTVGAYISPWLRAEAELSYASFGIDTVTGIRNGAVEWGPDDFTGTGEITATYLLANAWVQLPTATRFTPYAGGGIGGAWVKPDWNWGPGEYGHVDGGTAFAWQVGGGVNFAVTERWAIDLGYRYKAIGDLNITDTNGEVATDVDLSSHNVQLGVVLNF